MTSPAIARLVLAHVGEQRPAGDVADGVQPLASRRAPSGGRRRRRSRGRWRPPRRVSRPIRALFGVRPAATTTSSTTTLDPSDSVTVTSPPCTRPSPVSPASVRSTRSTSVPSRTSTPAFRKLVGAPVRRRTARCGRAAAGRAHDGQLLDAEAAQPASPTRRRPRRLRSRAPGAGTSCRLVTSREVHGSASRSPSTGGTAARRAGGQDDGVPGGERAVPPPARSTSTVRSPVSRPVPRTTSMPAPVAHCDLRAVVVVWVNESRRASTASTSSGLGEAAPRAWPAPRRAARPAAAAPCSACTPSRSTPRRAARSRR